MDTAGVREALDEADNWNSESMEAFADADLVLVVVDASQETTEFDEQLLRQAEARPVIVVENKCDFETGDEIPTQAKNGLEWAARRDGGTRSCEFLHRP